MYREVDVALNLRPISGLENMPVLDLESGAVLGRVLDWVFDTNRQKLVAFILNHGSVLSPPQVLVPTDIVEYGPRMILARNRSSLIHPKEVVGLTELMKKKSGPVGLTAISEEGRVLGKVTNLDIDTVGSCIQRYHISPPLVASITKPDLLIPANKFLRMEKNRLVFVDNNQVKIHNESQSAQTEVI